MTVMQLFLLAGLSFIISLVCTRYYKSLAIASDIVATPNFRTLHEHPIPRGGGLIFSLIFVLIIFGLGTDSIISIDLMLALGVGGGLAAIFGFADDVINIRASVKLIIQFCLAAWILICFDGGPLQTFQWLPVWLSWSVSLFMLLWMINLYNFIDGVDGMASSGAIYICIVITFILYITDGPFFLIVVFSLLAACCLGFLFYNWPPASVFMGDSGSVFLGYCFGALIVYTTMSNDISFWTWLIVLGYFVSDTTTTTILRLLTVKRWYGEHRSHAYQNLARIWDSHLKVTGGILSYNLLWLSPLAVWSSLNAEQAPIAVLIAVIP